MTNGALVREYDKLSERSHDITCKFCDDGLGHMSMQDIRDKPDCHPLAPEDIAITDRMYALRSEGKARYGPVRVFSMNMLLAMGPRRRVKRA